MNLNASASSSPYASASGTRKNSSDSTSPSENPAKRIKTEAEDDNVVRCAVISCLNTKRETEGTKPHVQYYPFPPKTDADLFDKWKSFCKKIDDDFENAYICSDHFSDSDYSFIQVAGGQTAQRVLNSAVYPTISKNDITVDEPEANDSKGNGVFQAIPPYPTVSPTPAATTTALSGSSAESKKFIPSNEQVRYLFELNELKMPWEASINLLNSLAKDDCQKGSISEWSDFSKRSTSGVKRRLLYLPNDPNNAELFEESINMNPDWNSDLEIIEPVIETVDISDDVNEIVKSGKESRTGSLLVKNSASNLKTSSKGNETTVNDEIIQWLSDGDLSNDDDPDSADLMASVKSALRLKSPISPLLELNSGKIKYPTTPPPRRPISKLKMYASLGPSSPKKNQYGTRKLKWMRRQAEAAEKQCASLAQQNNILSDVGRSLVKLIKSQREKSKWQSEFMRRNNQILENIGKLYEKYVDKLEEPSGYASG